MKRRCWNLAIILAIAASSQSAHVDASNRHVVAAPTPEPAVITLSTIKADAAARFIERFFPKVHLVVDRDANAIIVSATTDEVAAIRQIAGGIDTKSPLTPTTQSVIVHRVDSARLAQQLRSLYPQAHFATINRHTLLISADNSSVQQMQALITAIDAPPTTPAPTSVPATPSATEALRLLQAQPKQVAREVAGAVHGIRVQVAGQSIILTGAPDLVQRARDVIAILDVPSAGAQYTVVYRIKTLDAQSVAELLQRSFPNAKVTVDEDINSLSVLATAAEQRRIADGIAALDAPPSSSSSANPVVGQVGGSSGSVQVYTLKYALPGSGGAASTSAGDLAATVTQTLSSQAPDLRVMPAADANQLILTGNPYSIKLAKDLLAQLDVAQKLVVLDTEILEVDENTAKNLGLQLSSIVGGPFSFGTVYSEIAPTPDPNTGITPPLKGLQPLARTPFGFIAQLNLAIQHGSARVLADPRITTLSGHTATIRAGDNISIQLQAGGGPGTIATTQIQTFQTGVSLDITPIVNDDGLITVALHPVVNSLTGILNGIPQISTRDTQTTVALKENETLVIGGLIQDNTQRDETRIPLLGDLPLLGHLFRNETLNGNRNELIISVTPHIVTPGQSMTYPGPPLPRIPTPQPLPTLPPGTLFPGQTPSLAPNTPAPAMPTAKPSPSPGPTGTPVVTAIPMSSASSSPNTFTFGAPPANNVAGSGDPVQIFYASLRPTLLSYGEPFTMSAITSTNVAKLSISYDGVSLTLSQSAPGQWQASLPFTLIGSPSPAGTITLSLTAAKLDGRQTSVSIPVTIASRR